MNHTQRPAAGGNIAATSGPVFCPTFRYVDAPRAIEWLVEAFGFEKHAVYPNEDGTIAHAELKFGYGIVMLGSASNGGPYDVRSPQEVGGVATGGIYVVLERDEDIDRHCARARAAGATIIAEPEDADYGGRGYGARDLEGYYWSFGTYRPLVP
ncbi:MAG: VOC family protein [Candidatus Eremiobacteraeota bacterium]|nr:VOC family protein [Candidatus Eremiobacteraeota bacterium]